jgi:hypothetical protein
VLSAQELDNFLGFSVEHYLPMDWSIRRLVTGNPLLSRKWASILMHTRIEMGDADDVPLFGKPDSTRASLDMVGIRPPNPYPPKQGSNNRVYDVL